MLVINKMRIISPMMRRPQSTVY